MSPMAASDTARDFSLDWAAVRVYYNDVPAPASESVYPFAHYEVENGTPTRYYLFNGQAIALRTGTDPATYLHRDQVGSVVMTTQNGVAVDSRQYFAYGSKRGGDDYPFEPDYTGQRRDGTGLLYYNARYYDPELAMFISPDSMIPDPMDYFSYNRYLYTRGNPLKYNDPSGHDPLDDGWRTEFKGLHSGREPDAFDEAIRLFSLAYPDEWDPSRFYDENGKLIDIKILKDVFQDRNIIPAERNWNTLGNALASLAGWYNPGEESLFVHDVAFLFAGSRSRSQKIQFPGHLGTYWTSEAYPGNIHIFLFPGDLPEKFFVKPGGGNNFDPDANVHHWAWALASGYNLGADAAIAANLWREYGAAGLNPHNIDISDVLMGTAGANVGGALRRDSATPLDLPRLLYESLEMAP